MIVVELKGGLGNQMFQYALARALSIKNGASMAFDLRFLKDRTPRANFVFRNYDMDIFGIDSVSPPGPQEGSFLLNLLKFLKLDKFYYSRLKRVEESSFQFEPKLLETGDNVYLSGYFQSPKYFAAIDDQLRNDFSFKHVKGSEKSWALKKEIESCDSVCVNIRRTDFVNISTASAFHGFCGEDYIRKATAILESKVSNPRYYVFSDDVEWCVENLSFLKNCTFVDHSYKGPKFADYLMLMASCRHFCIPNSTFAWWAAYLAKHPDKIVVAPKNWFAAEGLDTNDLIPESWIRA